MREPFFGEVSGAFDEFEIAGVDHKIYVIESGYPAHRNSHRVDDE